MGRDLTRRPFSVMLADKYGTLPTQNGQESY